MYGSNHRKKYKILAGLLLGLTCVTAGMQVPAQAEEYRYYDYSDDLHGYAQKVAEMNKRQESASDLQSNKLLKPLSVLSHFFVQTMAEQFPQYTNPVTAESVLVLCKTDGGEVDFAESAPACVIEGTDNCYSVWYENQADAERAIESLSQQAHVIYAEQDAEITASAEIIDAEESSQNGDEGGSGESGETGEQEASISFHSWGAEAMHFAPYISYVNKNAPKSGKSSALIAIIDSGVAQHPMLEPRMPVSGYDYVDADNDAFNDLSGHGTLVAGIAADCTTGLDVDILPIRILDGNGRGKISNAVNAIHEAINAGADVINLSMESKVLLASLDTAIQDAIDAGVIVSVAAGNSRCDTELICPAHITTEGVIVVGGAEYSENGYTRSSYTNYGSSVDVYCFGSTIEGCSVNGGFRRDTGTSMSAPHISALSAMLRMLHPELTPAQVERKIKKAAKGNGEIIVPDLQLMIPAGYGFELENIVMDSEDRLVLPGYSFPYEADEKITYSTSDDSVATFTSDGLRIVGSGTAEVTAESYGLGAVHFTVTAETASPENAPCTTSILPGTIRSIEEGAFAAIKGSRHLILEEGVNSIGENAFAGWTALRTIELPDSVTELSNIFGSISSLDSFGEGQENTVLICSEESAAREYAVANGLQYLNPGILVTGGNDE